MDNFLGSGKIGNKVRDFPNVKGQDKESGQASGSNDSTKKNCFYALCSWGEQQTSLDMVTICLKSFPLMCMIYLIRDLHYILLLP